MSDDEEVVELTDRLGNFLNPGDIVAYSTSSKSGLKIGVFVGVKEKAHNTSWRAGSAMRRTYKTYTPVVRMVDYRGEARTVSLKKLYCFNDGDYDGRIPNMVVVQMPEFKVDIPEICKCLEIIEDLKDEGIISDGNENEEEGIS